jgi:hypothetical protein
MHVASSYIERPADGAAGKEKKRTLWSGVLAGIGLAAFLDEVVFHQLLHWHHFYDKSTLAVGLVSDGICPTGGGGATYEARIDRAGSDRLAGRDDGWSSCLGSAGRDPGGERDDGNQARSLHAGLDAPSEPPVARPGSRAQPFSGRVRQARLLGLSGDELVYRLNTADRSRIATTPCRKFQTYLRLRRDRLVIRPARGFSLAMRTWAISRAVRLSRAR